VTQENEAIYDNLYGLISILEPKQVLVIIDIAT
jgi:hypothetical protein